MKTLKDNLSRILALTGAALLCTALSAGAAADDLAVLPAQLDGAAPGLMMEAYLQKQAFAALDRREAAFEKLQTGEQLRAWQQDRREVFLSALGGFPERTPLNARTTGQMMFADYRLEKIIFESQPEPGIWLPALRFEPETAARSGDPVLYLHGEGKQADAGPGGPIETLALAGRTVLAVDLRGLGETSRPVGRDVMGAILGFNTRDTNLAHLMGKSFVAMRAEDVLACARYLVGSPAGANRPARVAVVARGEPGVPALHAAALEPQLFSSLELQRALASWVDVVRAPVSRNQKVNAVFGALRAYDLTDLVASLPQEKTAIREPLDATGQPTKPGR